MKTIQMLALALGLLVMGTWIAPAQDIDSAPSEEMPVKKNKKKKKKKGGAKAKGGAVVQALKKVKRVSGRVNQKAIVYVYLQSASWCGPCRKIMPEVVKMYKEMRKDGRVEMILVGHDHSPEEVKAYIEGYKCKMPAISKDGKNVEKLPGFSVAGGIPDAIIVDANGKLLGRGYPTIVLPNWKELADQVEKELNSAEEQPEVPAEDAASDEPASGDEI